MGQEHKKEIMEQENIAAEKKTLHLRGVQKSKRRRKDGGGTNSSEV